MSLKSVTSFLLAVTFSLSAFAQTPTGMPQQGQQMEVTDQQLKTFKKISDKLQEKQRAVQKEIEGAVSNAGLEMAQFQKMAAQQMRGTPVDSMGGYSEAQKAGFRKAMATAQKKQQGMMQSVQKMVKKAGMDMQTFQQIAMQLRSNPELQKRFQALQGGASVSPAPQGK